MNVAMRSHVLHQRLERKFQRKLRRSHALLAKPRHSVNRIGNVPKYRYGRHMGNDFFDRSLE